MRTLIGLTLFYYYYYLYHIVNVDACIKSSVYYRSRTQSRSHAFRQGEYQPQRREHAVEASGPLDARDFRMQVPDKRLVRVESPNIIFDSEEARWMTEGCRDRLMKLSTQIQNTWANNNIKLRVLRSWIQPPAKYDKNRNGQDDNVLNQDAEDGDKAEVETLKFEAESDHKIDSENSRPPHTPSNQAQINLHAQRPRRMNNLNVPIIDITPEMMVNEIDEPPHRWNPGLILPQRKLHPLYWSAWSSSYNGPRSYSPLPTYRMRQSNILHSTNYLPTANRIIRLPRSIDYSGSSNSRRNESSNHRRTHRSLASLSPFPGHRPLTDPVNTMSQLKFEQWLHVNMEEFHYAGRALDMQLTSTTPFLQNQNNLFDMGVLAQLAYYVAQFDWCYFSRRGHIHCSVKPDASISSQWFGCFPGSGHLIFADGKEVKMRDTKVGDHVMTRDPTSGALVSTPILAFIHRDEHAWKCMLRIQVTVRNTNNSNHMNNILQLTPNHLVYIWGPGLQTKFASQVKLGDHLLVWHRESIFLVGTVVNVSLLQEYDKSQLGLYAPLTATGTLIIDNIVVSCFAEFSNHFISNLISWPLQIYLRWFQTTSKTDHQQGVHDYFDWIYRLTSPWLPNRLLHSRT